MIRSLSLLALVALISASCATETQEPSVSLPFNLEVEVEHSGEEDGVVSVTASAQQANFYSFEFFHPDGSTVVEDQDGAATYTYQTSGKFLLIVRAHATHEYFIEETDTIDVVVQQDTSGLPGGIPSSGYTTPLNYPGYNLVWQDEFTGSSLSADWTHELGTGNNGWGNNELQYYREENTTVSNGYLIITAKKENVGGRNYTSSRIITKGQKSFQYGRIDIRAALPSGQGIWPALWMLGSQFPNTSWPACGEIDIMEMVGGDGADRGDDHIFGTVHWSHSGQHAEYGGSSKLSNGIYADEFHVFSIIWDSNSITWYRDDIKYHEISINGSELSEFREPFFFIFNVAVGGNWPGSPNSSTQFPQHLAVDYVRVFQK